MELVRTWQPTEAFPNAAAVERPTLSDFDDADVSPSPATWETSPDGE